MDFLQSINNWMISMPGGDMAWTILMFALVISVLVFVHEFGHYFAARSVGVVVETFSIGFGKELWHRIDKNGTRWRIAAMPLGGYVKMLGDEDLTKLSKKQQKGAFLAQNVWARMWIVIAGPAANFVFAILAITAMMYSGEQKAVEMELQSATFGKILADTPAQAAGLQRGDLVLAVDGKPVAKWLELVEVISAKPAMPTMLTLQRGEQTLEVTLTPEAKEVTQNGKTETIGRMGVRFSPDVTVVRHPLLESMVLGVTKTWDISGQILGSLRDMITRKISADQIGGPIMIAEIAGDSASEGYYTLLRFMVLISINLGLINLFPIPALDGGHLVMFAIEAVRRKPLGERAQEWSYRIGLGAIFLLMGFAIFNDLARVVERIFG